MTNPGKQLSDNKNAFLLFSMEISGIQDFLFSLPVHRSISTLPAQFSELETVVEQIWDNLLQHIHISKEDLLSASGGQCFLILPNKEEVIQEVELYMEDLNTWLKQNYDISLYAAYGYAPCTADTLMNMPEGSYSELVCQVEEMISDKKLHRYTAADIMAFNKTSATDYFRESPSSHKVHSPVFEELDYIGVLKVSVDHFSDTFGEPFKMSAFIKQYMNDLLVNPQYFIGKETKKRDVLIYYYGGDEVFIIGVWNEVLGLSIDLVHSFQKHTPNTHCLSGGFNIYSANYPISAVAEELSRLEEKSQRYSDRNAVTLFSEGKEHLGNNEKLIDDGTYTWAELEEKVLKEKFRTLFTFLERSEKRGRFFLPHFLELIQAQDNVMNFARYVYLLTQLEPDATAPKEEKQRFSDFSARMYKWGQKPEDRRELKTAIYLYAYLTREEERSRHADNSSELCR